MIDNVTLAIEKDVLERLRAIAEQRQTTLNELVGDYLRELVERDRAYTEAKERLKALMKEPPLEVGERRWTREGLHGE
jgi:DNA-binding FrmR family transcriptional regulator